MDDNILIESAIMWAKLKAKEIIENYQVADKIKDLKDDGKANN